MMSIEERKLLTDIADAISSIDNYLEGERNFSKYMASKIRRRAAERELEIIGEAVNNLLKLNPEIPLSYARIVVDLRNRIIHAYDAVNYTWKNNNERYSCFVAGSTAIACRRINIV